MSSFDTVCWVVGLLVVYGLLGFAGLFLAALLMELLMEWIARKWALQQAFWTFLLERQHAVRMWKARAGADQGGSRSDLPEPRPVSGLLGATGGPHQGDAAAAERST
jgi:hypothetical protein